MREKELLPVCTLPALKSPGKMTGPFQRQTKYLHESEVHRVKRELASGMYTMSIIKRKCCIKICKNEFITSLLSYFWCSLNRMEWLHCVCACVHACVPAHVCYDLKIFACVRYTVSLYPHTPRALTPSVLPLSSYPQIKTSIPT